MFNRKKANSVSEFQDKEPIKTIIGSGTSINGDLSSDSFVRIDGKIQGNLEVHGGAIIGRSGEVFGHILADQVLVYGVAHGNIQADYLELKETAILMGDIAVVRLKIEGGAKINGKVNMKEQALATSKAIANNNKEEAKLRLQHQEEEML